MYDDAITMAKGAELMTGTKMSYTVLGSAWPGHFNRPIAEAMYENIKKVGLPQWSEDDQKLAKGLQKELKVPERGLATRLGQLGAPRAAAANNEDSPGAQGPMPTGG